MESREHQGTARMAVTENHGDDQATEALEKEAIGDAEADHEGSGTVVPTP